MARKRLQYQAIAATLFVPTVIPPPPTGGYFSTFSQPAPKKTGLPAHLQPDSTKQFLYQGPPTTPGPLVFSRWEPPRFSQVPPSVETTANTIFETAFPPQQTLVFSVFSQPPPLARLPAHLHTTTTFEVQPSTIATNPFNWLFPQFSQPPPKVGMPAYLQPQVAYQLDTAHIPVNPPPYLVFSEFSPPAFYRTNVKVIEQPEPTKQFLYTGPASVPPWFVFAKWEPPRFRPVRVEQQPSPIFETFRPGDATPGPLVFSIFSQPKFGPVPMDRHTQPAKEIGLVGPAPTASPLVFSTFSQPRFTTTVNAALQPVPWQQFGPPVFIQPGSGAHRKFPPGGLEKVKKRKPRPPVEVKTQVVEPPFKPVKTTIVIPGAVPDLVEKALIPTGLMEMQAQIHAAQDEADIERFLQGVDQDEQDARDIADVIAALDDRNQRET